MKLPTVIREINLFVVVGVAATACQVGVSLAAQRWLGLGPVLAEPGGLCRVRSASPISATACLTFRRPALHGPQFARFATISLAGLAINLALVWSRTHTLGWPLWLAWSRWCWSCRRRRS